MISTARITIEALRSAILSTLAAGYSARAMTLPTCAPWNPALFADPSSGSLAIDTPALLLEIGPTELIEPDLDLLSGALCYDGERIEWRAYHIVSARPSARNGDSVPDLADADLHTTEMANITRAILLADGGTQWGQINGSVERPELASIKSQPVDLKVPGYACRVLLWSQPALLAETYQ